MQSIKIEQEVQDMTLFVIEETSGFKKHKRIKYQYSGGVVVQENKYTCVAKAIDDNYQKIEDERDTLKTQIGAYKVLQKNHDEKISHYSKKAQDITNAISTLESEREMNAILTNEVENLKEGYVKLLGVLEEAKVLLHSVTFDDSGICDLAKEKISAFYNKIEAIKQSGTEDK